MSFRFNANKIKLTFIPLLYKNMRKNRKKGDVTSYVSSDWLVVLS